MKKTLFALAALVAAYSSAAATYYVQVPEGTSGAVMKTIDGYDYWLKPIDLSGNISVAYDASWWYTPAKSSVNAITARLKKADGSLLGDITINPTDTYEAVYNSIRSKIPVSAANAYEVAAVALAKSMYNEIQTQFLRENVDTIAKTLQANLLSGAATEYGEYTTSDGSTIRVVDSTWLPDLQNMTKYASQLKQFRESFGTSGEGNVSVGKTSLVVEGTVGLGGGGGSSPTDAMSVTNLTYIGKDGKNNDVDKSVTTLAGWWEGYSDNGGHGTPQKPFLCDFKLEDLTKPVDDESREELNNHYMLTRDGGGMMHYIPMNSQLKAAVVADDVSITTNKIYGAEASGTLSLVGWNQAPSMDFSKWMMMSEEQRKNVHQFANYNPDIVIRERIGDNGFSITNLNYYECGSLYEMSWSTNWNEAAKEIAQEEATKIVNWNTNWVYLADSIASSQEEMRKYVDNSLNWSTNWFASVKDMEGDRKKITDYINGQLDIMTNTLNGIDLAVEATKGQIKDVRDYVQKLQDFQTNVIINTELAKLNGSIKSTQDFVNYTYDILTNQIAGIQGVIDSGDFASVQSVHDYVQAELGVQTNEMLAIIKALEGGVADSTKDLIDAKYDILTNMIAGINGVIESGDFDTVQTVRDYVQEVMNVQTNEMMNIIAALDNGVADSAKELIGYNFDILTNQIAGIKEVIREGDIGTVKTVGEYIERVIELQKNFVPVENWTYVTNYIYNYLGGDGRVDDGKPLIEPEDDPYSGEYESKPMTDSLLPVRNAKLLIAITNTPLSKINANHLLDFKSVNTNANLLVQIAGFDEAEDESFPVKRSGEGNEPDKIEWVEFPSELLMITTNNISEIAAWMRENHVTNIFTSVVTNSDALKMMTTNLFGHVKPDLLMDNASVWTNGERKVEVKGFSEAAHNSYPVKSNSNGSHVEWKSIPSPDANTRVHFDATIGNRSIESYVSDAEEGFAVTNVWQVYGFKDAATFSIPSVKDNEGSSGYSGRRREIKWITATGVVTNDGSKLTLQNYDSAAVGSFAKKGNNGKLEWATMLGIDDASITTNTTHGAATSGIASIYGFSGASAGDIPHKKNDGTIEWKPVAAGGALLVQGNYDSTVATCTNKLIFASESDSNVKFKVTQGTNGNVTVTVGVYYK